jgi:lysyl endopeptidase
MPATLHDRYVTLYDKFAKSWRVTKSNSLFDYAPGTSTATFTNLAWPVENAKTCTIPNRKAVEPVSGRGPRDL